jgi:predicted HAD superfamily Cof-like phosphohydrolase
MKQINSLNQVADFHKTFNAPILNEPQIPSSKRCELRVSLLQEELNELREAIENNDLIEALDAFCDIKYVLNGAILEFGLQNIFDKAFNEVQRSNMSKACDTELDAQATLEHYKQKDGTEGYYKENNGKWLVYRKEDDKVLKSVKYSPADLKKIINE